MAPLARRAAADGLAQLADVLRRGAAAAADDVGAEVAHERRQLLGHLGRAERVDGLAVDVQRQAGVRDHDDRQVALLAQVAHRLAQVLGADGAVECR